MASKAEAEGPFVSWYQNRIGDPSTGDEARGYWVFALGALLGAVGMLLFLNGAPAGALREWGIVLASAGLALVFAGPIIRLPIQQRATWLVGAGLLVCAAAIVWFIVAFPDSWSTRTGQPTIVGLYGLGLVLMAVAGVFVPILTDRADLETRASALESELDELRRTLADTEADEADLAAAVKDLRGALADTKADEEDLARLADRLRQGLSDATADEEDLAAQLRRLRTSQSRFELFEDKAGEYRWRLRHRNGNVIATSGEGYTRRHNAENGMQGVRRDALGATVLLYEEEESLPEEEAEFEPVEETPSEATFELYEDKAGEYRWRLRHDNGNIIADGGQGYASRQGAETAIDRIRTYAAPADYLRPDPTAFEVYQDAADEWRWRLIHRNGNVLADSGEGYSSRSNARRAVARLRDGIGGMEFETYEDSAGEHRWRLLSSNDRIVADSGEGYSSRSNVEDAVERVREYAPEADHLDIGQAVFEVFEDTAGDARWRLRHRNGNIVADGGQGYADRSRAWDGIESVKRNAANADLDAE